jgi:ABC-type lipoprotein release transport system permease subunit
MMMNAAAQSGVGHLCVVPDGWRDTRSQKLRLADWEEILAKLRTQPEVMVATPRARTDALLAFGTRSTGVEMVGVDPTTERVGNRLLRRVVSGRYLEPGERGSTVIGEAIADRFRVEVEDQLMVTVAGSDGDMRSAMLQIVGVVATGSRELDSILCHTSLEELATLSGFAGATEIAVTLNKPRKQLEPFIAELRTSLPPTAEALSWTELRPELEAGIKVDETWARLTVGIIMIVVFLGIASAQLAAALERRREFAVLSSLGMPVSSLWRVMISEGILLGIAGSFVGLLIGIPITGWVARQPARSLIRNVGMKGEEMMTQCPVPFVSWPASVLSVVRNLLVLSASHRAFFTTESTEDTGSTEDTEDTEKRTPQNPTRRCSLTAIASGRA